MLEVKNLEIPVIGRSLNGFYESKPREITDTMEVYEIVAGEQSNGANYFLIQTEDGKTYLVKNSANELSNYEYLAHVESYYLKPNEERIKTVYSIFIIRGSYRDNVYFHDHTESFNHYTRKIR